MLSSSLLNFTNMAKAKSGNEFYVKLENIQLSAESVGRIEAGIQSLVMSELAGYKPNPDDPYPTGPWPPKGWRPHWPIIVRPPRPWPGLIARKLLPKEIAGLNINEELANLPGRG
jgi:hypothetical protein